MPDLGANIDAGGPAKPCRKGAHRSDYLGGEPEYIFCSSAQPDTHHVGSQAGRLQPDRRGPPLRGDFTRRSGFVG